MDGDTGKKIAIDDRRDSNDNIHPQSESSHRHRAFTPMPGTNDPVRDRLNQLTQNAIKGDGPFSPWSDEQKRLVAEQMPNFTFFHELREVEGGGQREIVAEQSVDLDDFARERFESLYGNKHESEKAVSHPEARLTLSKDNINFANFKDKECFKQFVKIKTHLMSFKSNAQKNGSHMDLCKYYEHICRGLQNIYDECTKRNFVEHNGKYPNFYYKDTEIPKDVEKEGIEAVVAHTINFIQFTPKDVNIKDATIEKLKGYRGTLWDIGTGQYPSLKERNAID